uniref:HMG box domain-containing protein n=1 Tax=Ascaris lumbricoides TaxID=6252 RepID=A0A0M3HQR2_ASCLU
MGRTTKMIASNAEASSTSPVKKQKRAKKDPNAPKRGRSSYMFWLAENRARLTQPGMSVVDVTRAAGAEWNTIEDKSKWEKLAAEDKKRYEKELVAYKGGVAPSSSTSKAAEGKAKK